VLLLAAVAGGPALATAADPPKADRAIGREPAYKSRAPRYGLLAFGPDGRDRVWLVQDGDTLYVDRNGNGDLIEPRRGRAREEAARRGRGGEGEYMFEVGDVSPGGKTHKAVRVAVSPLSRFANAAGR
jgi:hypothetical protein